MHLIKRQLKLAKKPGLKKSKKQTTKAVRHLTRETAANVFALTRSHRGSYGNESEFDCAAHDFVLFQALC